MSQPAGGMATCERHGVETRLRCAECGKPICLRCQVRTEVGLKCEVCAALPAAALRRRRRAGSGAMVAGGLGILLVALVVMVLVLPGLRAVPHPPAAAPIGHWAASGDVPGIRGATLGVVLPDGRLVVAGGGVGSVPLDASAVYDPAQARWTPAGRLHVARRGNAMAVLADGRVVVVGGIAGSSLLASTEVFDPRAGTWSELSAMTVARLGATLTALPDGRLLAAGGLIQSGTTLIAAASAELLDPASGTWTPTRVPMLDPRYEATASALKDGRVLIAGGRGGPTDDAPVLATAEVYDPSLGIFTRVANLHEARRAHSASLLAGGRILVAGGSSHTGVLRGAEIYDPAAGAWTVTGSLLQGRRLHGATVLTDGRVLVAGGESVQTGARSSLVTSELYDPASGRWTPAASLSCPRSDLALLTLPGDGGLAAGGDAAEPGSPPLAQGCSEVFKP